MIFMIRQLEACKVRSNCIASPLTWVLVDDPDGVYLLWTGHMTVFPVTRSAPATRQSLQYSFGDVKVPSREEPNMFRAFLCYLYAIATNQFQAFKGWKSPRKAP